MRHPGLLILASALALGCGSTVSEAPGGAGGASSSASSGSSSSSQASSGTTSTTGSGGQSGDCATDADCPGSSCVEVLPGGFRVCKEPVVDATGCTSPGLDACCTTDDCGVGRCLAEPLVPYCGGPQPAMYNVCAVDACASDADCGQGAFCAPEGTLGRKIDACAAAACRLDTDCTAEAGGACMPVAEPCCNSPIGLFCVYPGGCRSSADCAQGEFCEASKEGARCEVGDVLCPA